MKVRLTASSFRDMLVLSRLMDADDVRRLAEEHPGAAVDAEQFASLLVDREYLTQWQADKLLQAKHRGFFLGSYQLRDMLARGGMSSVYAALHRSTGEPRALKVLPVRRADKSSYLSRFMREARLTSSLDHPNIVRVDGLETGSDGKSDIHFMVMELLDGEDLDSEVRRTGPLSIRDAVNVIRQAACGLDHAHAHGLVHRDVKPGNLFRGSDGVIRILDLGLAGFAENDEEKLTRQYDEKVLGTADYLAPEQAVDSHTVDHRADIYALGCVLYFLLVARPPFTEGTIAQRIVSHQMREPVSPSELREDVPEFVLSLHREMTCKKREDRIPTAAAVADRISNWLSEQQQNETLIDAPARMKPVPEAAPTADSSIPNRAAGPGTAPSSPSASGGSAADDSAEASVREQDSSVYTPEFAEFLSQLDSASGIETVMTASELQARRDRLSHLPVDNDHSGPSEPDNVGIRPQDPAVDNEPHCSSIDPPSAATAAAADATGGRSGRGAPPEVRPTIRQFALIIACILTAVAVGTWIRFAADHVPAPDQGAPTEFMPTPGPQ